MRFGRISSCAAWDMDYVIVQILVQILHAVIGVVKQLYFNTPLSGNRAIRRVNFNCAISVYSTTNRSVSPLRAVAMV